MSISNPQFIPYQFNSFFVEVAGKMLNQDRKPDYVPVCENTLSNLSFLAPVTEEEVLNVISNLKGKLCAQSNTKPLTFIFNLSLCSGTFPNLMKIAKVRPIYKKGQTHELSNYRPISLSPAFSKILETLIYKRVVSF
jgi:hypothetical protein